LKQDILHADETTPSTPGTRQVCQKAVLNVAVSNGLHGTLLDQAITYSSNQLDKLSAFLNDGRLEIDNNRSESAIKPFVIGRKNWLYANTPRGAKASSTIYSVIERKTD
jgi:hypothetical protein